MKIIAICGSPRKGNTYSVHNVLKDNFPDIDYKILMLKDMNFEICKGCYQGARAKPTLKFLVPFQIFKLVSEIDPKLFSADYEYYKDKKDFFYDTRINPLKTRIAKKVARKTILR